MKIVFTRDCPGIPVEAIGPMLNLPPEELLVIVRTEDGPPEIAPADAPRLPAPEVLRLPPPDATESGVYTLPSMTGGHTVRHYLEGEAQVFDGLPANEPTNAGELATDDDDAPGRRLRGRPVLPMHRMLGMPEPVDAVVRLDGRRPPAQAHTVRDLDPGMALGGVRPVTPVTPADRRPPPRLPERGLNLGQLVAAAAALGCEVSAGADGRVMLTSVFGCRVFPSLADAARAVNHRSFSPPGATA